jgi:hypothetical protein
MRILYRVVERNMIKRGVGRRDFRIEVVALIRATTGAFRTKELRWDIHWTCTLGSPLPALIFASPSGLIAR